MKKIDVAHIYYNNWQFGVARDYKEVPTNIKQTLHATPETIERILESPWCVETLYPFIAQKLIERTRGSIDSTLRWDEGSFDDWIDDINWAEWINN